MPTYNMKNKVTGEVREMYLTISGRDEFLKENPDWEQALSTPRLVSQVGSNISKTDGGWKEVLGKIKKGSGRGNTIKL